MRLIHPSERVGTRVAGKYQIVRIIGEGGMGAVYEARHVQMDRRVAVKMLRAEFVRDHGAVERFLREARTAASVGHKSIVQILDFGEAEDGTPFIVMATRTVFVLSFLSLLKYAKQRDMNRAPTSLNAIVGP